MGQCATCCYVDSAAVKTLAVGHGHILCGSGILYVVVIVKHTDGVQASSCRGIAGGDVAVFQRASALIHCATGVFADTVLKQATFHPCVLGIQASAYSHGI